MANKYYRCDLTAVHETNAGGRIHSVKTEKEIPNGVFCVISKYVEGSTEIKKMVAPKATDLEIAIVQKPEINYDERFKADQAIGEFRNEANSIVPAVILSNHDGIDLSQDYFGAENPQVGEIYTIEENLVAGTQLKKKEDTELPDKGVALRVIGVKPSCIANFIVDKTNRMPKPYNMIQLEVVIVG